MVTGAYTPRNPKASALYQCVQQHFAEFEVSYATRYQEQYGFYRPVISRVVEKTLRHVARCPALSSSKGPAPAHSPPVASRAA